VPELSDWNENLSRIYIFSCYLRWVFRMNSALNVVSWKDEVFKIFFV